MFRPQERSIMTHDFGGAMVRKSKMITDPINDLKAAVPLEKDGDGWGIVRFVDWSPFRVWWRHLAR